MGPSELIGSYRIENCMGSFKCGMFSYVVTPFVLCGDL